jgi:hypothetical protein
MGEDSHFTVFLDQLSPCDRAATLLSLVYTNIQRILLRQPELALGIHPTILLELGRLGFCATEPLRIIIRHGLKDPPRYWIKPALSSFIPDNKDLQDSVLSLYGKCLSLTKSY